MLQRLAIRLIEIYQYYISPYKGFACAYRIHYQAESCSQYAKQAILQFGLLAAYPHIKQRLIQCKAAAHNQSTKKVEKQSKKSNCASDLGCDVVTSCPDMFNVSPKGCVPDHCGSVGETDALGNVCSLGDACSCL